MPPRSRFFFIFLQSVVTSGGDTKCGGGNDTCTTLCRIVKWCTVANLRNICVFFSFLFFYFLLLIYYYYFFFLWVLITEQQNGGCMKSVFGLHSAADKQSASDASSLKLNVVVDHDCAWKFCKRCWQWQRGNGANISVYIRQILRMQSLCA